MSNLLDACLALELPVQLGAPDAPTEFRIFAAGEIDTTKGKFLFDEEAAKSVMDDLASYGNELAIDYNHGMAEEKPMDPALSGRAAGWFTPEVRNGELWASKVRWTPAAAAAILAGEWRYQSPWFVFDKETRRIGGLLNTALTNTPATKNLTPLVASRLSAIRTMRLSHMPFKDGERVCVLGAPHMDGQRVGTVVFSVQGPAYAIRFDGMSDVHKWYVGAELAPADAQGEPEEPGENEEPGESEPNNMGGMQASRAKESRKMLPKIAAVLSLSATATEAEVLTVATANKETASALLSVTGKSTASEALGVVQGWKATAEKVPAMQEELAGLRKSATKSEVDAILSANAKKVSPAMRAEWEKLGLLDDPKRLAAMLSVMPEVMPVAAKPPEGSKDTEALTDGEMAVCRASGTDPKEFAKHKAAMAARR